MSLSPAYHLRTNKGVERLLFLDLLRRLDGRLPERIEDYRYVGLGGPYLEDFGMVHAAFGNRRMLSLEIKEHVRSRQLINRPYSRIRATLDSTSAFVENYQAGAEPLIVWFDYEWQDWKNQMLESVELIQKLPAMSIFKITLTGKTAWLGGGGAKDPLAGQAKALSAIFEDYGPFDPGDINEESICSTLYTLWRRVVADAIPDTEEKTLRTLAAYEYNDGTPVLTVTMIIGPIRGLNGAIKRAELKSWPFAVLNWRPLKKIDVPSLGLRERLAVDRLMPDADARTVVRRLKLQLGENYTESLKAISNYIELYRYVPQLIRVAMS